MKQLGSEGSFPEPCAPHPFILGMGSSLTALPLLHHTGVSGAVSHGKYSLRDMERGCGKPCHSVCGLSPEIFSGISLYCLKESVLGSGGWGQMMRKILISLKSAGQNPVWKITNPVGQNWLFLMCDLLVVCQLDCFLKQGKERNCGIFLYESFSLFGTDEKTCLYTPTFTLFLCSLK